MTIRPLWGNVLVRPVVPTRTTKSGITLPESAQDNTRTKRGIIEAVGSGSLAFDGSPIPMELHVGEAVSFKTYEAESIIVDNTEYYLVDQRQVNAVLHPDAKELS